MANLAEDAQWEEGVYQLEVGDMAEGGPDGISNLQAKQLANRTGWLKQELEEAKESIPVIVVSETEPEDLPEGGFWFQPVED
jgi:hypothetical protein